jgi:hypothetical protein
MKLSKSVVAVSLALGLINNVLALDVVSYSMPDGANAWGAYYDNKYNGSSVGGFLSGGVGDLTDGVQTASVAAGYGAWAPYVFGMANPRPSPLTLVQ